MRKPNSRTFILTVAASATVGMAPSSCSSTSPPEQPELTLPDAAAEATPLYGSVVLPDDASDRPKPGLHPVPADDAATDAPADAQEASVDATIDGTPRVYGAVALPPDATTIVEDAAAEHRVLGVVVMPPESHDGGPVFGGVVPIPHDAATAPGLVLRPTDGSTDG
jgi:hypothetical protein